MTATTNNPDLCLQDMQLQRQTRGNGCKRAGADLSDIQLRPHAASVRTSEPLADRVGRPAGIRALLKPSNPLDKLRPIHGVGRRQRPQQIRTKGRT